MDSETEKLDAFFKMLPSTFTNRKFVLWMSVALGICGAANIFDAFSTSCCDSNQRVARDFSRINLFMAGFVIAVAVAIGVNNGNPSKIQTPYGKPSHTVIAFVLLIVVCIFGFISNGKDEEDDDTSQCAKKGVWVHSSVFAVTLLLIVGPPLLKKFALRNK